MPAYAVCIFLIAAREVGLCLSALLCRGRGRQVGDGRTKAHSALQGECGLYVSPLAGKASPVHNVVRADSVGFYSFPFGFALPAFGSFTATLAAAEGEQDGNDAPAPICPLRYLWGDVLTMQRILAIVHFQEKQHILPRPYKTIK